MTLLANVSHAHTCPSVAINDSMEEVNKLELGEKGFTIVKGLLGQDIIEQLKAAASRLVTQFAEGLAAKGRLAHTWENEPFETRFLTISKGNENEMPTLFRPELHMPEFYHLFCNRNLIDIVHDTLPGAEKIRIYPNYSMRPKLPDYAPHEITWHQDSGLTAEGQPATSPQEERWEAFGPGAMINCWTPLVPVRKENGAMMMIPGSYKMGIQEHKLIKQLDARQEPTSYGRYMSGLDPSLIEQYKDSIENIECDPGDVVFFYNVIFHRGGHNQHNSVRWSLDWRYQNASKPTPRPLNGHVVYSSTNSDDAVGSAEEWAQLSLS